MVNLSPGQPLFTRQYARANAETNMALASVGIRFGKNPPQAGKTNAAPPQAAQPAKDSHQGFFAFLLARLESIQQWLTNRVQQVVRATQKMAAIPKSGTLDKSAKTQTVDPASQAKPTPPATRSTAKASGAQKSHQAAHAQPPSSPPAQPAKKKKADAPVPPSSQPITKRRWFAFHIAWPKLNGPKLSMPTLSMPKWNVSGFLGGRLSFLRRNTASKPNAQRHVHPPRLTPRRATLLQRAILPFAFLTVLVGGARTVSSVMAAEQGHAAPIVQNHVGHSVGKAGATTTVTKPQPATISSVVMDKIINLIQTQEQKDMGLPNLQLTDGEKAIITAQVQPTIDALIKQLPASEQNTTDPAKMNDAADQIVSYITQEYDGDVYYATSTSTALANKAYDLHHGHPATGHCTGGVYDSIAAYGQLGTYDGRIRAQDFFDELKSNGTYWQEVTPNFKGMTEQQKIDFLENLPPGYIVVKYPTYNGNPWMEHIYISLGKGSDGVAHEASDWVGDLYGDHGEIGFYEAMSPYWTIRVLRPMTPMIHSADATVAKMKAVEKQIYNAREKQIQLQVKRMEQMDARMGGDDAP